MRKWFQIHMSTALVLTFAAGCLVFTNIIWTTSLFRHLCPWVRDWRFFWLGDPVPAVEIDTQQKGLELIRTVYWGAVAIDLAYALVILVFMAIPLEWAARYSERQRVRRESK